MEVANFIGPCNLGVSQSWNSGAPHTKPAHNSSGMPYVLASGQGWKWAWHRNVAKPCPPTRTRRQAAIIRCGKDGDEMGDMNRRELLLASTTALGLAGLHLSVGAEKGAALPLPPPDLSHCHKPNLPQGVSPVNCCPPYSGTAIDFQFPTHLPMRIRQAAHLADEEYIEKYTEAVRLMRNLPADDPRNFTQQADVHCAYCDGAYYTGSLPIDLDIHNSWFFLPWHRWYLYFHERILAKLIGDDSFALPFWNWDSPQGYTIPSMYVNNEPLQDRLRDAAHQPPTPIDLNFSGTDVKRTRDELIASNNNLMYRQIVSGAKTTSLFQGSAFRYGDNSDPGAGTLENSPHGPVHVWTGDRTQPNGEDMGNFYSAGRDPIFFAHHANVDRMWTIWKTLGGRRRDYSDKDFLESQFLFYDENAELVRVRVADALDPSKLRFTYQRVDIPWLNARPKASKKAKAAATRRSSVAAGVPRPALAASDNLPSVDIREEFGSEAIKLVGPLHVRVKRAHAKLRRKTHAKEEEEEVLLIEGIEVKRDRAMKFDVFINTPEADSDTSTAFAEFAGTFVNVPHHEHTQDRVNEIASRREKKKGSAKAGYRKSSLRLGISEILEDLGAEEDESIIVTLIPKGDVRDPIRISGIKIVSD